MTHGEIETGAWQPWFAWRPVILFGSFKFAWLRGISRRQVLTVRDTLIMEYSDMPGEYPSDCELQNVTRALWSLAAAPADGLDYRGHRLHQKTLLVGWQIVLMKDGKFICNGSVLQDREAAFAEARAAVDMLLQ